MSDMNRTTPDKPSIEDRSQSFVEQLVKNNVLLLDSSVATNQVFDMLLETVLPITQKYNRNINIPCFAYEYILSISKNEANFRHDVASETIKKLNSLIDSNNLKIFGQWQIKANSYTDIFKRMLTTRFCIFVQFENQAGQILNQAIDTGMDTRLLTFCKINRNGSLWRMNDIEFTVTQKSPSDTKIECRPRVRRDNLQFFLSQNVVRIDNQRIITTIPSSYQAVYRSDDSILWLKNKRFVNADSITYATDKDEYFAKIYNADRLDTYKYEKCKLMTSRKISISGVCWPVDLLYNDKGIFVGVLVPKAEGLPLHLSIFKTAGLAKYFPNWRRVDVARLAVSILDKLNQLHRLNILMGCINPASILVRDSGTVHFTDTDNYQIEGFPCLMKNVTFTPPEYQKQWNTVFLINKQNEFFSVAILVFMILLPGKMPYSRGDSGDSSENISEMKFPYPYKENHSDSVPPGFWRFVWSHLSYALKENFFKTFRNNEAFSQIGKRRDTYFWLNTLLDYLESLENGKLRENDPESENLFPTTLKRSKDCIYVRCISCGREYSRNANRGSVVETDAKDEFVCHDCWSKMSNEYFVCEGCGNRFYYSIGELYIRRKRQAAPQKRCSKCSSKKEICRSCNREVFSYKMQNGICEFCRATTPCTLCGKRLKPQYLRNGRCKDCNMRLRGW